MNFLVSPAVSLDIAFFVIIALGVLFGVIRGFLKSIVKWAGLVGAAFLAFTFCNAFQRALDDWFSLTNALTTSLNNETLAGWIAIAISFTIIFIGTYLLALAVGSIGTVLVDKIKFFGVINKILGGLWGACGALVLIFLVLMVCNLINSETINAFIAESSIVGKIYVSEWFRWAATLQFIHQ